jgi:phage tail-like protein
MTPTPAQATAPAAAPAQAAPGWLVRQLPVAMLQDDLLVRFTSIFEQVAGTLVHSVDTIGVAADLSLTPDEFVHWLGSWIGAPADPLRDPQLDPQQTRERDWVRAQAQVLSARGTRSGLEQLLAELAGGHPVEIRDGGGVYREGHCPDGDTGWVQVRMPLPGITDPSDVLELIRAEVPIGVDVDLVVLPTPGAETPPVPQPRAGQPVEHQEPWDAGVAGPYWDGHSEEVPPTFLEAFIPEPEPLEPVEPAEPALELSAAARRLPGTNGRAGRPARICPVCAERNEPGVGVCQRCGSAMRLVPPVPQAEPEPVRAIPEPELWLPERRIWPVVVLVAVVVLLLGALAAAPFLFSR